ncbi:glycosyltransferase family A protein [Agaribacter flavus]|uniref:Glycosyltransferase family A protein n=1 Tax=Agaribacter flavus TaxID=1902781 RepID=A0ABV7FPR5_9ALTE
MYNIVMFAYNEEKNIQSSLRSIFENKGAKLNKVYLIANGCTDATTEEAENLKNKLDFTELNVISLDIGDKCNAWNHYMHNLSSDTEIHFFVDADVKFSPNCFEQMHEKLEHTEESTVAIAGFPLSGRNIDFYRSLVIERACFFGNLYGLKNSFVNRIKEEQFHLPIGLNWIDSFLTKAVNTDLQFFDYNLPNRVTYLEGVGYSFTSLSPLNLDDIKLYFNRIARYELGKIQEKYLDALSVKCWPENMFGINEEIAQNFEEDTKSLSFYKKRLVKARLSKLVKKK